MWARTRTATSASMPPSRALPSGQASLWRPNTTTPRCLVLIRLKAAAALPSCSIASRATVSAPSSSRTPAASPATQELGILALIQRGVRVLTANGDDLTDSSDPSRKMMRQIAGAFHQYEKARLVAKLQAARQRKRGGVGKVEGREAWGGGNTRLG